MASPGAEGAGKQVRAENRSTGSQFLADGHGDLNAASGNGVVYKDHRVFNFATPGIPLGWNLAETLNEMGNALHRPQNAAICEWLKKQKGSPPLDACRQYYVETKSQMVNGTGSWILQNEQFRAWKDPTSRSTKLALEGILGSGKTMLAFVSPRSNVIKVVC
ncbi:unnamed protein product [Clonostachys rosea]|uniref:Nephrocystin 3-like N-terminal domain-containing protein n=1 Tax=Bionectria ochroleuca TaxID=29856 RepID=A0ABY6U7D8_BIOOC|nr:unnamed protein product [Clonostachys rosea]